MISQIRIEPQIVEKRALRVAGMRYEGRNEHGEIPMLWDNEFLPRMGELDGIRVGQESYGVARELAGGAAEEGFEYLAGVEVKSFDQLPPGMVGWETPAMTCAVIPVRDVPGIQPACDYFYNEWLPQSQEYEGGDAHLLLEEYPPTFGQDMILLLCFPVKPKKA